MVTRTLPTAALLLLTGPLACFGDGRFGLDATIEASAGLSGSGAGGEALHGLALAHGEWSGPTGADTPAWRGYLSLLALQGRGPTERFAQDFLAASNLEGYASARLYSWWLEAARDGWSLRGGALLADEEFAGTDAGGNLCNSAFGWPAFISANTVNTGPAFFVAAPGLRLAYTTAAGTTWRLGVYDGDSFDSPAGDPYPTRHGLHYRLGGGQGCFLLTEATFTFHDARTRLTLGAWLHTADFADVRDDDDGQPVALSGRDARQYASNQGGYVILERTLRGQAEQAGHVGVFLRAGGAPTDRNAIAWAVDTGLAWTGPLAGRPADILALGVVHAKFGGRFADGARLADPTGTAPDFEQVIELNYTVSLSERFSLQPDLQFIRHPGGSSAQRDACVALLRFNASY